VLTSTYAADYSKSPRIGGSIEAICCQLLRAAYLGTILAALSLGKRQVVLTMIGGGVFGNPHQLIWESLCWAVDEADTRAPQELTVVLNAWGTDAASPEDCAKRGGKVIKLDGGE
jgi:O-acetyl-ADP-ribose deacetylase (regulator of RNase III)